MQNILRNVRSVPASDTVLVLYTHLNVPVRSWDASDTVLFLYTHLNVSVRSVPASDTVLVLYTHLNVPVRSWDASDTVLFLYTHLNVSVRSVPASDYKQITIMPHPSESILNPTIQIGDFMWAEPVTTLTDFCVALMCWYAVFRLLRVAEEERVSPQHRFIFFYFLFFAIGMTSAAWLGHGLQEYITPRYKVIGWILTATGLMFLQQLSLTLISNWLQPKWFRFWKVVFVVQWLVFVILVINPSTSDFKVSQLNSVLALIVSVLPMHLIRWKKELENSSKPVVVALLYGIIPGIIYTNEVSINRWFNYHDISHVLMAIFMFLMFKALFVIARKPVMT